MPPGRTWDSAIGTSSPTGANSRAASSGSGSLVAAARPGGTEAPGEGLGLAVAGAGEGVEDLATGVRQLGQDMRRGAEAIEAQPARFVAAGQPPGAIADQARAQQRRGGPGIIDAEREAVAGVGHAVLGVAAVAGVTGELGALAEVLAPGPAGLAHAAGPAQPGHADPLASFKPCLEPGLKPSDALPQRIHLADDLVAGHQRQPGMLELAVDHVQIGAAYPAGQHLTLTSPGPGSGIGTRSRRSGRFAACRRMARISLMAGSSCGSPPEHSAATHPPRS